MGLKSMVIDAWSWLNYKPVYSDPLLGMPNRKAFPEAHGSWVPAADERRLAAYKLLAAYDNNQVGELAELRDGPHGLAVRGVVAHRPAQGVVERVGGEGVPAASITVAVVAPSHVVALVAADRLDGLGALAEGDVRVVDERQAGR
ncbi:hypothetical protein ACIRP2_37235 [Streptomyces sp. NPDC101194]|uniref:hypothetical protein n=1 Tax=Streptomyces sp. NPDC101194 TaxID=3366127 RepID=UPI0038084AC1